MQLTGRTWGAAELTESERGRQGLWDANTGARGRLGTYINAWTLLGGVQRRDRAFTRAQPAQHGSTAGPFFPSFPHAPASHCFYRRVTSDASRMFGAPA